MALTGREPMNPRGRQYALGGTLDGWTRLTHPTPRQRRALALSFAGLNPMVYSRYGARQLTAPLPWTRLVVKDPFAMLSVPVIVEETGALPVIVYRHPGAVLASYRRMGWTPDLDEVQAVLTEARSTGGPDLPDFPDHGSLTPAEAMGHFWSALHELGMRDIDSCNIDHVVVAHHELARSGPTGGRRLCARLGIGWNPALELQIGQEAGSETGSATALHNFDRAPVEVAEAWRSHLEPDEVEQVEAVSAATLRRLEQRSLPLLPR